MPQNLQPPEGAGNLAAAVHLLDEIAVFFWVLLGRLDYSLGPVDGRSANAEVAGDLVAGGPLTFGHCGRMTEVRPDALPLAGLAALQWLDGAFQRDDLAGQQILADEVLVRLAAGGLKEIHDSHRNLGPAERPAGLQPPLSGNQPTFEGDDNRVQQTDFADAVGKRTQVAEILAIPKTDLDLINIHARDN